jgi:hypothetical protein
MKIYCSAICGKRVAEKLKRSWTVGWRRIPRRY